jgi:hypothetical protein
MLLSFDCSTHFSLVLLPLILASLMILPLQRLNLLLVSLNNAYLLLCVLVLLTKEVVFQFANPRFKYFQILPLLIPLRCEEVND